MAMMIWLDLFMECWVYISQSDIWLVSSFFPSYSVGTHFVAGQSHNTELKSKGDCFGTLGHVGLVLWHVKCFSLMYTRLIKFFFVYIIDIQSVDKHKILLSSYQKINKLINWKERNTNNSSRFISLLASHQSIYLLTFFFLIFLMISSLRFISICAAFI